MSNQAFVTRNIENGLCTIAFHHPAHNSLPSELLSAMSSEILLAGLNPEVKLILLRSEGEKTFCAGASFDELLSITNKTEGLHFFSGFANVINAIRTCKKIVIARVHGKAIGGGVGIAAAADYSMATKWATFRLSELAVGIGPFVIGPAVERKIGLANFAKLSLTPAEWQTAEWAKNIGLYQESFETVEQLDNYLKVLIDNLLSYSPMALAELKKVFWQGTDHWDSLLIERANISGELILSDYAKSAIQSFKVKA